MSGMPTQVLVVEDDQRIAASIRRALAYEGYSVAVAHSGTDGLAHASTNPPDLLILDLMLPGLDGLEVCRRLREAGDEYPILMLTARDGISDRVGGLDAGADDYLVKPFAYEELLARVRALLRRVEPGGRRERLTFGPIVMDVDAMDIAAGGERIELTALEFRLLEYFMRNQRVVLSRNQILLEVWGLDADTSSNIVDVYISYLRSKLGPHAGFLQTVRGAGYVLRRPE